MSLPYDNKLIWHAKSLRKEATLQENRLWYDFLRSYPVRFQRQKVIRSCIVDFYCHAARLVIELDGSQHYEDAGKNYDSIRDTYLKAQGLTILRYANSDVDGNFRGVCEDILQHLEPR